MAEFGLKNKNGDQQFRQPISLIFHTFEHGLGILPRTLPECGLWIQI